MEEAVRGAPLWRFKRRRSSVAVAVVVAAVQGDRDQKRKDCKGTKLGCATRRCDGLIEPYEFGLLTEECMSDLA